MSAELLAEEIVRLELLAKLSTRYKAIQSVSKRYIHYCRPSLLQYTTSQIDGDRDLMPSSSVCNSRDITKICPTCLSAVSDLNEEKPFLKHTLGHSGLSPDLLTT